MGDVRHELLEFSVCRSSGQLMLRSQEGMRSRQCGLTELRKKKNGQIPEDWRNVSIVPVYNGRTA